MKRFQFRLARLARVRTIQEEQARAEWQAAQAELRRAEARVSAHEGDIRGGHAALRRAQAGPRLAPGEVLCLDAALGRTAQSLVRARRNAARREAEAELLRAPWQRLRTQLEGLARLEDKARTRHRLAREREETQLMDQVAAERAARATLVAARDLAPRPHFDSSRTQTS